jgi:hypothetical protein
LRDLLEEALDRIGAWALGRQILLAHGSNVGSNAPLSRALEDSIKRADLREESLQAAPPQ